MQEALETPPTATPTVTHSRREAVNSVRATCEVLRKALHDKVFSVSSDWTTVGPLLKDTPEIRTPLY